MSWRIGVSTGVCIERPILGVLGAIAASGAFALGASTIDRLVFPSTLLLG